MSGDHIHPEPTTFLAKYIFSKDHKVIATARLESMAKDAPLLQARLSMRRFTSAAIMSVPFLLPTRPT